MRKSFHLNITIFSLITNREGRVRKILLSCLSQISEKVIIVCGSFLVGVHCVANINIISCTHGVSVLLRFITDRVRSTTGSYVWHVSVCPHGRGVPWPGPDGGYSARSGWGDPRWSTPGRDGVPPLPRPGQDGGGGYPRWANPPLPPVQNSRWSTWYAAVCMPLAFRQEDFLIYWGKSGFGDDNF